MKLSVDFGRWTTTKAALAVAGALVIGGAIGSAVAISPTVPAPIKWDRSVEIAVGSITGTNTPYTVPAGKSLLITDLIVSNNGTTKGRFHLYATNSSCGGILSKLQSIVVPPESTYSFALQTGIGFGAGKTVCFSVTDGALAFNARGYLFTAAPVS